LLPEFLHDFPRKRVCGIRVIVRVVRAEGPVTDSDRSNQRKRTR